MYKILTAAAVVVCSSAPALAGDDCFDKGGLKYGSCVEDSFYVGLKGGAVFLSDTDIDVTLGGVGVGSVDASFDAGWAISGVLGYELNSIIDGAVLRPELELGYQTNDFDSLGANGVTVSVDGADVSALYGFVNLYADIPIGDQTDFILGGGLGFASVDIDPDDVDDTGFAYHLDAGLGYDFSPNLTAELTYRYLSVLDLDFDYGGGNALGADDASSHQILVGLRYRLD